jgi:hypothetical protein
MILKTKSSKNLNLRITFTGQRQFLEVIKQYYNSIFKNNFGSVRDSSTGNFSVLTFGGINSCLVLTNWLYKNSSENNRLDRKYKKVVDFITQSNTK